MKGIQLNPLFEPNFAPAASYALVVRGFRTQKDNARQADTMKEALFILLFTGRPASAYVGYMKRKSYIWIEYDFVRLKI